MRCPGPSVSLSLPLQLSLFIWLYHLAYTLGFALHVAPPARAPDCSPRAMLHLGRCVLCTHVPAVLSVPPAFSANYFRAMQNNVFILAESTKLSLACGNVGWGLDLESAAHSNPVL